MRKLAWFVIFAFLGAFGVTLGCAVNAGFKTLVVKSLAKAGGTLYTVVADKWMAVTNYVSQNGTYFLFYTLGILAVGGIFWIGVRKLWAWGTIHRPHLRAPPLKTPTPDLPSGILKTQTPTGATIRPPLESSGSQYAENPETPQKESEEK